MNLHCLHETPTAWLGEALDRFERQFWYPLGPEQRFRISHGRNYLPFFQAMGRAIVLVAERGGDVLGTLARVERRIHLAGEMTFVHYLCDLKVAPAARGSRVLPRLMHETHRQIESSGSRRCYSVVMGGTGRLPVDYTGRAGIPGFEKLADVMVLRLSPGSSGAVPAVPATTRPAVRVAGGKSALRSMMAPLSIRSGDASAVLEDTRLAKRLWMQAGDELLSAHVSDLRFNSPASGAEVLRLALTAAQQAGYPAIFTAMPTTAWNGLQTCLPDLHADEAPAAVFGHDLPPNCDWWVNTSEI